LRTEPKKGMANSSFFATNRISNRQDVENREDVEPGLVVGDDDLRFGLREVLRTFDRHGDARRLEQQPRPVVRRALVDAWRSWGAAAATR